MSNVSEKENQESDKRKEFVEAFDSAETLEESLDLFKKMEESELFQESELGLYCWPLSLQLQMEGNNSQKVVSFGERALQSLLNKENSNNIPCTKSSTHFHHLNYVIAQVLNSLGYAAFDLKQCSESLRYFERADAILCELDKQGSNSCPGNCVLSKMEVCQLGLFAVRSFMGRKEEAATNIKKVAEIREKTMEEGCMTLGKTYKSVYELYLGVADIKEALPFCVKALEIYRKHMGCDSLEVGKMLSDLGILYSELGECEKALEQTQLALSIMKRVATDSHDLLSVEVINGGMLRDMGRYEESIEVYRGLASHAEVEGSDRANAFCGMAKASFSMGRFDDAKVYMRTAQRIYEKEEMDPRYAACGYEDMSRLYEKMNDNETAILLVRRVLAIPKIPQKLLLEASTRLFMLVSLVGKEEKAIPYMEDAVEKLKDNVGSKNHGVGYGYKILGVAYMKSGQPELALKCLTNAKDIMDVYRGPNHLESLETSHKLAVAYAVMKRIEPAIEIEEKVVAGLKGLGPSGQEFLDVAVKLLNNLNEMKEIMSGPAWPLINAFANVMR